MDDFFVPTDDAVCEFVEKRSRFIGHVWKVETEDEAVARIKQMRSEYYDAKHNVYAYLLREGGVMRYSDDGEPQGTAGMPVLEVFRREGVLNVCCVVTRYFGGILLGAGGLVRAYARSAKLTLEQAGISIVRRWTVEEIRCPYPLFDRIRMELAVFGAVEDEIQYGADVVIRALLPEERAEAFRVRVVELSAGGVLPVSVGQALRPVAVRGGSLEPESI